MAYDPTQQVPQPGGYPQQPYQQPQYPPTQQAYPPTQQGYQQSQPGYPPSQPGYPQQQPVTYTQYDSAPPPPPYGAPAPGAGFDFNAFWKKLGMTGQVCAISGLVLFFSFLLPWFSASVTCTGPFCGAFTSQSGSANAFSVASHSDALQGASSFAFTLVWLVILASIALVVLPILGAMGKLVAKQAQLFILIASGAALLFEIIYMIAAFSAVKGGTETSGSTTISVSAGPGFGFWLGFLATLAAGGVYVYFNYLKKPAVPGMMGMPLAGQPPYSQPGSQPYAQPGSQPYQQPGSQPYPPQYPQQQYPGQYPGQQPPQYPQQ